MSIPATREWVSSMIAKSIRASGGGGGESSTKALADMTDVVITNPTNNQVLTYNASTNMWENKDPQGGGGSTLMAPNFGTIPKNGISIIASSASYPLNLYAYEYSAGHEGFTFPLLSLEIGKTYKVSFDWTNRDCGYIGPTVFCLGYKITDTNITDWQTAQYDSSNPNQLNRLPATQHIEDTFVATADIMYFALFCNGYSDDRYNYFLMSNFTVEKR